MSNKTIFGVLVVFIIIGVGYWAYTKQSTEQATASNPMGSVNSGENSQPGSSVHDLPVESAAAVARKDLATKLGVEERSIVIMQIEEKTWSDGCLGLGGGAELCTMALVDGFRVEMEAMGKTYVYRTDKTGASIRAEIN